MMENFVKERVLFVYDKKVLAELDKIQHIKNRAELLFDLIQSYDLFKEMDVIRAVPATYEDLVDFHSTFYIDSIKDINTQQEEDLEEIGLTGDCPVLDDMFSFVSHIAGGSLVAAQSLLLGKHKFAINWCGGWHHAQRDMAEGFCYVNDIVLAILRLSKLFDRILYIDLDVHHGNGVENAFASTQKVFTLSLHRNGVGFYPNTGDLNDIGSGKGRYYAANVPFQSGTSDKTYTRVFHSIIKVIHETYQPQCLVIQCGADSLAKDELGDFNVSSEAFGEIISHLVSWSLPSLFLGGGGYNIYNSARYWTYLTSIITRTPISTDIPDESEHFMKYGPDFTLPVTSSYGRRDENSEEALKNIVTTHVTNIGRYVTSPCVNVGQGSSANEVAGKKEIVWQKPSINEQNCETCSYKKEVKACETCSYRKKEEACETCCYRKKEKACECGNMKSLVVGGVNEDISDRHIVNVNEDSVDLQAVPDVNMEVSRGHDVQKELEAATRKKIPYRRNFSLGSFNVNAMNRVTQLGQVTAPHIEDYEFTDDSFERSREINVKTIKLAKVLVDTSTEELSKIDAQNTRVNSERPEKEIKNSVSERSNELPICALPR